MPGALATSWMLLMLGIGAGLVIAGYLAYRDGLKCADPEPEHVEQHAAGIEVGHGRVPRVLTALYVGMGVAMIGYVLYAWLVAPNI
jgi:ABC-type Fe3+-siderophore transport system permease subunit